MKYIIGVDEVGRGPLAGPVSVCAVLCEESLYKKLKRNKNLPASGRDSKKLSPNSRQNYSTTLKDLMSKIMSKRLFDISVAHISNKEIDRMGISYAIKKAIQKCLKSLLKIQDSALDEEFHVLLDGGLRVPVEFMNKYPVKQIKQTTIIKGDEKEKIIAWASILAKVSRDALLVKVHKKYPEYDFHIHKGYGTVKHRAMISKYGLSEIHRKSFCKKFL